MAETILDQPLPVHTKIETRRGSGRIIAGLLLAATLAACGGSDDGGDNNVAADSTTTLTSAAPATIENPKDCAEPDPNNVNLGALSEFTFRFDDLGGGYPTINVYGFICPVEGEPISSGTFNHGDEVTALCKARGRIVPVDTAVGEEGEESGWWVRIHGTPDKIQYAPDTYGNVEPSLDALREC